MGDLSIEFKLALNVVASAVSECLSGQDFQSSQPHEPPTVENGRIIFPLKDKRLGEVGRIVLRELDSTVKLQLNGPHPYEEKRAAIRAGLSSAAETELRETKRSYRQHVFERLMSEMEQDGLLTAEQQRWKQPAASPAVEAVIGESVISKRGRRGYGTIAEKRQAILDWDALDPSNRPRQEDWLESQFGETGGVANVKPRTLQGWRRYKN